MLGICTSACSSSYDSSARDMRTNWSAGNFSDAGKIARDQVEEASEGDALVWQLDYASILRAEKRPKEALAAFERAAGTLKEWDEKPEIQLSKEAVASIANLSSLPYRGRSSDAIMLHTYRALSFLENGNADSARVALNAAYQAQKDAVERNAKEIENAQKEASENKASSEKLISDSGVQSKLDEEKKSLENVRVLADYVNPFSTWLYGIYFLNAGRDSSDVERARNALSRVKEMYKENKYVAEDLAACEATGKPSEDKLTYVVFESGLAPTLGVTRIDLMLPVPGTVAPVSIALPKLVLEDRRSFHGLFPFASVQTSSGNAAPQNVPELSVNGLEAQEICDMNSVVRTDFDNAFPAVLTRTLVTSFIKTAASAAANAAALEYARRDGSAGASAVALGTVVGTSAFTYGTSGADVRCWQTLPQNFSIVRLKTPKDRKVTVKVGAREFNVTLDDARVNLVVVKTTSTESKPVVMQSVLAK